MDNYLEFKGIGKTFPGVQALKDVSFRAESGKVIALMGENGAGKSTLLKILSGDLVNDEGEVIVDGKVCHFSSPRDSINAGISVIYQERQLVPQLSVMENIFMEALPTKKLGFVDRKQLRTKTQELIDLFGINIKPTDPVGALSVAYQQMVEIMKSYRRNSHIIAFDEPTAPLTDAEISILFRLIRQLRDEGKVVIYVSHRMKEIFELSDEIVVMKDGRFVAQVAVADTNERELIKMMVGRDIGDTYADLCRNEVHGDVLLEVRGLTNESIKDISFELRKGEVLGLAGLAGAGRTETVRAIFGADPLTSGEIYFEGKKVTIRSPKDAIKMGIALCPEDRKEQGLILDMSIAKNVSAPIIRKLQKLGMFVDTNKEKKLAESAVEQYRIKTPTIGKITRELSGGNQQKVILGRWMSGAVDTKLLILDEPTKGIDVGAKAEIYKMICDIARNGIGVIMISSELTEVINLCDNILVLHNGHITGKLKNEEATEEKVLSLAMLE